MTLRSGTDLRRRRGVRPVRLGAVAGGGGTVTLRPNATVADGSADGGAWAPSSGTLHGVTADDSDATTAGGHGGISDPAEDASGSLILGMGTSTIPGTIASVTIRVRCQATGDDGETITFRHRVSGSDGTADTTAMPQWPTVGTLTGTARTTKPGGGAWDQAAIDALEVKIACSGTFDTSGFAIHAVYADVAYTT